MSGARPPGGRGHCQEEDRGPGPPASHNRCVQLWPLLHLELESLQTTDNFSKVVNKASEDVVSLRSLSSSQLTDQCCL